MLDAFHDDEDDYYDYIVLPLLRKFDDPPFTSVLDVLDFVQQTLEVCFTEKKTSM